MKTLKEITNGYQSTFEHMSIMAVASRLEAAACCGNEADDVYSEEFYDCVQCILYGYVVSGSFTAAEIPCDVSILIWVNAQHYVINWFNDYNVLCDDDVVDTEDMMYEDGSSYFTTKDMEAEYEITDDMKGSNTLMNTDTYPTLEQLKACIGDYTPHPYSAAYLEMFSSSGCVLDEEYVSSDIYDAADTEITEDMMYPDGSSHFITKDMESVSCKDCPDDECMSCCYR